MHFDFASLPKCPGDVHGKECFTTGQIKAIKKIYEGVDIGYGITYPGFPFGGENEPDGWRAWITGPNEVTQKIRLSESHRLTLGLKYLNTLYYRIRTGTIQFIISRDMKRRSVMHLHILMLHQQTIVDLKTTKEKLFSGMDGTIRLCQHLPLLIIIMQLKPSILISGII